MPCGIPCSHIPVASAVSNVVGSISSSNNITDGKPKYCTHLVSFCGTESLSVCTVKHALFSPESTGKFGILIIIEESGGKLPLHGVVLIT